MKSGRRPDREASFKKQNSICISHRLVFWPSSSQLSKLSAISAASSIGFLEYTERKGL